MTMRSMGKRAVAKFADGLPVLLTQRCTIEREAVAVGLPATLLLDPEGCELAVLQGPAEWHSQDGKAVVEALIGLRG